jgi:hypothetical protein
VTDFCFWSGTHANAVKCGVSGIRYATDGKTQSNPLAPSSIQAIRNSLRDVKVQGQPVPFHHPDAQPYPYLGVELTLTLNYTEYYTRLIDKLKTKTRQLSTSFASGPQRLRALTQCVMPGVTYAFPILPIGPSEVNRCDAIIAKCAKHAMGLPNWVANRAVHMTQADGGLGIPSLHTHMHQLSISYTVKAMNDAGTLGLVTRALLLQQLRATQGLTPT